MNETAPPATASSGGPSAARKLSLLYLPGFHEVEKLEDQYARMLWYVSPMLEDVGTISLATGFDPPAALALPDYADPAVADLKDGFEGLIEYFDADDLDAWRRRLDAADVVLHWDTASPFSRRQDIKSALAAKTVYPVDPQNQRREGSFYIFLSRDHNGAARQDLAASRDKFAGMLDDIGRHDKAYVFGTGPSLGRVMDMDLSDGVAVACNSMVRNRPLMRHLRPKIIALADPIFHAGFSRYAGVFRRHLYEALDDHGCYLVVLFRDYRLYMRHLPPRFRDRLIGIPLRKSETPNLCLSDDFNVTAALNVLTLLLLPLACTLAGEVNIAGCDGRKLEDDRYFWDHHRESQINDEMDSIKKAHPSFFDKVDYNDYYREHVAVLEKWLTAGEETGKVFRNLTPSHIPCLESRSKPPSLLSRSLARLGALAALVRKS